MESIKFTDPSPKIRTTLFGIQGMTCSACTNAINDAVAALPSVQEVSVNLLGNSMTVTYDENGISSQQLVNLVEDLGYDATEWETGTVSQEPGTLGERVMQIRIVGIANSDDVALLDKYLEKLGLLSYSPVTVSENVTTLRYIPSYSLNIRSILSGVPRPMTAVFHQRPSVHSRSREIQRKEARDTLRLFLASTLFAIPTFVIGVVGMLLLPKSNPFRQWCEGTGWWGGVSRAVLLLWILATCVQFGIARIFFVHGWQSLRFRRSWSTIFRFGNMNLLVALSTGVAYVASVVMMVLDIRNTEMLMMNHTDMQTYFDSCVFLTFFILAGKALEARAKLKTGDAIAMLGELRPERALLLKDTPESPVDLQTQQAEDISVDLLEIGDHIVVRPGSTPPADGTILEGSTTVNESSLTGESIPVLKQPGDTLLTGTMVISSPVVMRVDHLGGETMLQQIVRAVGESQGGKAPMEELADKITSVFVPVIIYLSLIVSAIWLSLALSPNGIPISYLEMHKTSPADRVFFALGFAIAVLAIACPCGIGLAAPAAQAVGAGMAARAGILAQGGGIAFQLATCVDTVVFDKTGTLTQGVPSVVGMRRFRDDEWLLRAVHAIEQTSSHPLATALVSYSDEQKGENEKPNEAQSVDVMSIDEIPGKGTLGRIQIKDQTFSFRLGNQTLIGDTPHSAQEQAEVDAWKRQGYSIVYFALSRVEDPQAIPEEVSTAFSMAAIFAIADPVRPEAKGVIAALKRSGKRVYMLSGDNVVTATTIGRELGIESDRIVAGVLPTEKARYIHDLKEKKLEKPGRLPWSKPRATRSVVMFAGDGLNDSAAVAEADVGIAFAHGSQITLTSASFVLLQTQAPLQGVLDLLNLSRKVYRRQKFNFGWAMVYNIILIPLAAGAFYPLNRTRIPPVWSALAMALSSLSVVVSSLALRWGI